jgi:DNA gyrase subunit A
LSVREFSEGHFVVLATRRGYIKKTPLSGFSRPRAGGIIAVTIEEGDHLLAAELSSGSDEIFMATSNGKSIRFNERDVRPMGRTARGVIGIRLAKNDEVVEAEVLSGKPDILTVTQNGYGKRTPVGEYRLQGRGGSGIINMRTTTRNGSVVGCMAVSPDDQLLLITATGKIIRMGVAGISRIGRATQGVRVIQTAADDTVVSAVRTAQDEPGEAAKADAPPTETPKGPEETA